ncbi:MAG: hypothetical protein RL660_2626 [Bacteroidota bacterium]
MHKLFNKFQNLSVAGFALAILVLNTIQAAFTQLSADESLYAYYASHMSWGYFDHPPLIALYVWLGTSIASFLGIHSSELAVRASTVISFSVSIYVLWLALDDRSKRSIFFASVLAFFLPHLFGFISTPDSPLFLCTSLFLWQYKLYCDKASAMRAILLGICMALMMYCKYHAGLFIVLIVIGNLRLLRHWQSWLAVLVALLCFTPHIWWQVSHQFPTLQYHLSDRATRFKWQYVPEYLASVLGAYALLAVPAIYVVLRQKMIAPFYKSLQVAVVGFLLFFLVYTLRGHVQAQWVMPCVPPLILLLSTFVPASKIKFVRASALACIVVQIMLRLFLILPQQFIKTDFHGNKQVAQALAQYNTQKLPVLVHNSYQIASLYRFYAGDTSVYNTYNYYGRAGEYQVHKGNDAAFHDKDVLLCFSEGFYANVDTLMHPANVHPAYVVKHRYVAFDGLQLKDVKQVSTTKFSATIYNSYAWPLRIDDSTTTLHFAVAAFDAQGKDIARPVLHLNSSIDCKAQAQQSFSFNVDAVASAYSYRIFLVQSGFFDGPVLADVFNNE